MLPIAYKVESTPAPPSCHSSPEHISPIFIGQESISPYLEKGQESDTGKIVLLPSSPYLPERGWHEKDDLITYEEKRLYDMNEAWKMVWCLFEFRSGGVQRKRPPARAFSPCSPALSSGAPKTPISFPLISSSKPAVFRDIFSCLVVSDWLWSSCCLRAALYTNSEQCQKSKIIGMPIP